MFPWIKIKKITPKETIPEPIPIEPSKQKHLNFPSSLFPTGHQNSSVPIRSVTSTTISVITSITPVLTRRKKKNICRKFNRQQRKEKAEACSGEPVVKTAPRLKCLARNQERRAKKLFSRGLLGARVATKDAAEHKELLMPDFRDASSSIEHRTENEYRQQSRDDLKKAEMATIRSLRLKEAAKASKKKDTNPIDPFFDKSFVKNKIHESFFK